MLTDGKKTTSQNKPKKANGRPPKKPHPAVIAMLNAEKRAAEKMGDSIMNKGNGKIMAASNQEVTGNHEGEGASYP